MTDIQDLVRRLRGQYSMGPFGTRDFSPYIPAIQEEAAEALEALQKEVEELRKDAERYRWMRSRANVAAQIGTGEFWTIPFTLRGQTFDAAVDAAIASTT